MAGKSKCPSGKRTQWVSKISKVKKRFLVNELNCLQNCEESKTLFQVRPFWLQVLILQGFIYKRLHNVFECWKKRGKKRKWRELTICDKAKGVRWLLEVFWCKRPPPNRCFCFKNEKIKPKSALWLLRNFESENWPHPLSLHASDVGAHSPNAKERHSLRKQTEKIV